MIDEGAESPCARCGLDGGEAWRLTKRVLQLEGELAVANARLELHRIEGRRFRLAQVMIIAWVVFTLGFVGGVLSNLGGVR